MAVAAGDWQPASDPVLAVRLTPRAPAKRRRWVLDARVEWWRTGLPPMTNEDVLRWRQLIGVPGAFYATAAPLAARFQAGAGVPFTLARGAAVNPRPDGQP